MSEWNLIILLVIASFLFALFLLYPLSLKRKYAWLATCLLMLVILGGYFVSGDFKKWAHFKQKERSAARAEQLLQTIKSPQELINRLRAKLDESKESAQGWYLLGRLYLAQNDLPHAVQAFKKAHDRAADNEQYTVNYAHALWLEHHQQFTPKIIQLFKKLLQSNPNQADALAMLAMHAFMQHKDKEAINYWKRLLKLTEQHTEESKAIRKAIAKAQERMLRKH